MHGACGEWGKTAHTSLGTRVKPAPISELRLITCETIW